ncbi:aminotransferase class V-fold PLP-dependent enzyme [Helicobacter sp. MIT 14-3879]|uniref:aminotransferase class V-fold PLP-dependent enzyme n=1 Tax=Helicobacter sp. MIT 14-3879 TaxID=2040649 RepID=UPI002162CC19|nr:aminotransferase class V-fold PLP-dependent enzyme [Helicobacter sp. MIT 14-3879]
MNNNFFRPLLDDSDLLAFVRDDIILQKDTLYFDWTASGLESKSILRRMENILGRYANTHSNSSRNAKFISELYLEAKVKLKELLGLSEDFFIIPSGYGASGAMKKYQEIKGIYISPLLKNMLNDKLKALKIKLEKPKILIGPYEHHSNEISLREGFCECLKIPLNNNGIISLDSMQEILDSNSISFASINIASNVSGVIAPFKQISSKLRTKNIDIAFDLAAISAHNNVSCDLFDNAFLSPHKLLGGIGSCGILCIKRNSFDTSLPPTFSGGGSVKYASANYHYYIDDIEQREDSGTPPILELFKAVLAYQYRNEVGLDFIQRRERVLYEIMLEELREIEGIEIYGIDCDASYLPIISFNVDSISPYDLAYELSYYYGIETRAGCSCAGPYGHYLLNKDEIKDINLVSLKPAWLRVSLHYSHNFNDIEYFISSIKKIIKRLR